MLCSNSCPKGQFYDTALFMQLSHNWVAQQSLNSLGWSRKKMTKGDVWGQEVFRDRPAPGLHFRASGQTGGQCHSTQGQGRGHHHVPRCPSCCPFDTNRGEKRGIILPSEEIPMRAARGTDERGIVLLRLHTHCHNEDNCLKALGWEYETKEFLILSWDFTHWVSLFQHMITNSFSPWENWTHPTGCRGSVKARFTVLLLPNCELCSYNQALG